MTINNAEAYVENLWDWGILRGCFGKTKIEPTDIDGFLERRGAFLAIETKAPNVPIKTGQRITYEALIDTGFFTVIFVWGEANRPEKIELWLRNGQKEVFDPADLNTFRYIVKQWYRWADKQGDKNAKTGV